MSIWRAAATVVVASVMVATTATQSKFTVKVHTGRGQVGYDVNSTMIIGERDILLIDPQFSLSEAHKLAAEILESKKRLATIYCTHPHPDHLFGLAVLKIAGLVIDGGYVFDYQVSQPAKRSWAQDNLGYPSTAKVDPADITSSLALMMGGLAWIQIRIMSKNADR